MTNPITLIGSHRSGTSWFGKILESAGFKGCFEPFNMFRIPELHRYQVAPHYSHIVLAPTEEDEYLSSFATPVFGGRYHTSWTKSRNKGSLSVAPRLLIKDIYMHTFFAWAMRRFSFTPIIIIRHPGGVIQSMEEVASHFKPEPWEAVKYALGREKTGEWLSSHLTEDQIAFIKQHGHGKGNYFGRSLCRWLMDNRILLIDAHRVGTVIQTDTAWESDVPRPIPLVRYEALCDHPSAVTQVAMRYLGVGYTSEVASFIQKSTARDTTSPFAVTRDPSKHRDAWKEKVTPMEMTLINHGLSLFELDKVVADG